MLISCCSLWENSTLDASVKEKIRSGVVAQLRQTWQGKRVDRAFVQTLHENLPVEVLARFDTAERLAPIMTTASGISGNPRLIKRFLNALSIRMAISNAQGVGVDEAVLAKLLLFERLGNSKAFAELMKKVSGSDTGKPTFLGEWEAKLAAGETVTLPAPFDDLFFKEWLSLPPGLAQIDLRGALYVSREHAPLINPGGSSLVRRRGVIKCAAPATRHGFEAKGPPEAGSTARDSGHDGPATRSRSPGTGMGRTTNPRSLLDSRG